MPDHLGPRLGTRAWCWATPQPQGPQLLRGWRTRRPQRPHSSWGSSESSWLNNESSKPRREISSKTYLPNNKSLFLKFNHTLSVTLRIKKVIPINSRLMQTAFDLFFGKTVCSGTSFQRPKYPKIKMKKKKKIMAQFFMPFLMVWFICFN